MKKKLVVKVLTGSNDPERTAQAFTVAATAAASGVDVSLWLTSRLLFMPCQANAKSLSFLTLLPYLNFVIKFWLQDPSHSAPNALNDEAFPRKT